MATLSYLTQAELTTHLTTPNLDGGVSGAVIQKLKDDGFYPNPSSKVWVEDETVVGTVFSQAQVLVLSGTNTVANVDLFPNLSAVVSNAADAHLLVGSSGKEVLVTMGTGNDTVDLVNVASATVMGGSGDDVLGHTNGSGASVLYGDDGSDTLYGGSGNDTLYAGASGSGGWDSGDNDKTVDWLQAGTGAQLLVGGATAADQTQVLWDPGFGAGNSTLDAGTAGGNHYMVGDGDDTLLGGSGRDTLIGGDGNGYLEAGGGGNILVSKSDGSHGSELHGGSGNDIMQASQLGGHDTLYATGGNDTLYGGSGDAILDATGSTGNNWLQAGAGAGQQLLGGVGDDVLYDPLSGSSTLDGGAGNDYIVGTGADTLIGGQGDDILVGGAGLDMSGGAGDDLFIINGTSGSDTVSGGSFSEYNRIWFVDQSMANVTSVSTTGITFGGGQTVEFTDIKEIFFGNEANTIKFY